MKTNMYLHINNIVTVTLTAKGAQVYNQHYAEYPKDVRPAVKAAGEEFSDTLWEVMRIFGSSMYNGGPNLFEPNHISFEV